MKPIPSSLLILVLAGAALIIGSGQGAEPNLPLPPAVGQRLAPADVDWEHPIYQTSFDDPAVLKDWRLEGGKSMSIADGKLILESMAETNVNAREGHLVCWLAKEVPGDFLLEFSVRPQNRQQGLNIVFFNTRGTNGASVFDPSLRPRNGVFQQYYGGDLNNYHISYWASGRGTANVRKNHGFHLVAAGNDLVATGPANSFQTVRIYKRGGLIRLMVDDRVAVAYDDDGKTCGPVWTHSGWIGLRQMAHTVRCEYDHLKIWPLKAGVSTSAGTKTYPFFPFCIDWHDAKKRSFQEQAQMLKELGYDGVGHIWLDKVAERLKSLDDAGLKLFQITMTVDIAPGKPAYDGRFKEVLALVKGRQMQFDLLVGGLKSSDPSGDARAVEILREMSDLARESGAQLLLYPHQSSWIERIEDSVRVADKVDRPNVGVMFNLCHWLRVDKQRDYKPLLKQALPRLWAVSINGADEFDDKPGWARYIQPLDKGSFDMGRFLKTLKELGYQGPIGLQCYGIGGDAREHLARSIIAWRKLMREE